VGRSLQAGRWTSVTAHSLALLVLDKELPRCASPGYRRLLFADNE
jgi:hypothetical protein